MKIHIIGCSGTGKTYFAKKLSDKYDIVSSLTVGCADCDVEMYQAIGFQILLGNMLAYGGETC